VKVHRDVSEYRFALEVAPTLLSQNTGVFTQIVSAQLRTSARNVGICYAVDHVK